MASPAAPVGAPIERHYRDGVIVGAAEVAPDTSELPESSEHPRVPRSESGDLCWVALDSPAADQLDRVQQRFSLPLTAVEDALTGHQRSKIERYDDVWFVVVRSVRVSSSADALSFGEVHLFVGEDFVVTVQHGDSTAVEAARHRLEDDSALLARGSLAVLYAVMDAVVDDYAPAADEVHRAIDAVEDELFSADGANLSQSIFRLGREILMFQRAVDPLKEAMADLVQRNGLSSVDRDLRQSLRNVSDHVKRTSGRLADYRTLIEHALTVNATLVNQRQNDISLQQNQAMKKVSGWAGVLVGPTLIGTIYGMNFVHMPELRWEWGYPAALGAMAVVAGGLYALFRRKGWI